MREQLKEKYKDFVKKNRDYSIKYTKQNPYVTLMKGILILEVLQKIIYHRDQPNTNMNIKTGQKIQNEIN